MATPNFPMAKHVESPFTLLKHYCSVLGFALPICKTKEIQKSTVIRITQWMLVGPHFAGPSRTVSPVGHYNLPSQNQQAAGWWHAWWKGLSCPKGKEAKTESWKSEAQFTDVCHGFQRAMNGAKESGMDRTDGNELSVYMEMIKGEIGKKKKDVSIKSAWWMNGLWWPSYPSSVLACCRGAEQVRKQGQSDALCPSHPCHRYYWARSHLKEEVGRNCFSQC